MSSLVKSELKRQLVKNRQNVSSSEISEFFIAKVPCKKKDAQLKQILEDLALLIIKSHMPVHFVESPWLKRFALQLNLHIVFMSKKIFQQDVIPTLVQKTKEDYVLLELFQCVSATANFDLWMSKGAYDIFALVINFLDGNWKPKKVTIGFLKH